MDLKIRNEISRSNSFTFSNISSLNGSQNLVEQQVSKLVKFVQCQKNTIVRNELEMLLPPLVCHLFIEMLKGKDWRPAHEFLRKYSLLVGAVQEIPPQKINGTDPNAMMPHPIQFLQHHTTSNFHPNSFQRLPSTSKHPPPPQLKALNIEEQKLRVFKELMTNFSCIRRLEDVKDNRLVVNFLSCKYTAKLARKSLSILHKYLTKHGHVLIIQIFHVWFSMNLYELHEDSNDDSSGSSSDCTILNNYADYSPDVKRLNHKIDRYSDPSHCDNPKDIKFSVNNRFTHNDFDAPVAASMQISRDDIDDGSNMKLIRLRDSLHRVDNKYHKPIRIFNINYSENR